MKKFLKVLLVVVSVLVLLGAGVFAGIRINQYRTVALAAQNGTLPAYPQPGLRGNFPPNGQQQGPGDGLNNDENGFNKGNRQNPNQGNMPGFKQGNRGFDRFGMGNNMNRFNRFGHPMFFFPGMLLCGFVGLLVLALIIWVIVRMVNRRAHCCQNPDCKPCPSCGKSLHHGWMACPGCGHRIEEKPVGVEPAETAENGSTEEKTN